MRALVFTLLTVVLSSGSHVLMTSEPLPWPTVLAAAAGSLLLALLLGRRERSYAAIAALLVPLELALDTLFTDGQAQCYQATGGGPLIGPWHSVNTLICGSGGPTPVLHAAGGGLSPWLVLAAHLLVGLLAAWWLSQGETAAFRLARAVGAAAGLFAAPLRRALRLAVAALLAPEPQPGPGRRRPERTAAPARPRLRHTLARRGPPPLPRAACC
ncbi:hypothetical protein GXW83_09430 [Streptacidiphilus sp. PB12-B1b]|nr:hypothetical protein GXW83_09430 [Streptacidiphilus sp. PB12-B1b]